jgi:hypothetical protein
MIAKPVATLLFRINRGIVLKYLGLRADLPKGVKIYVYIKQRKPVKRVANPLK